MSETIGRDEEAEQPLFTIGVTTYKRPQMLAECLASIQDQTFEEFEVIVGNNDVQSPIAPVADPRIRIINHAHNLGQIGNMNALLSEAGGRYFTWLADDDLYDRRFLESIRQAIRRFGSPRCVFTGYQFGDRISPVPKPQEDDFQEMAGSDFVAKFLARDLQVLGCYGVWDYPFLVSIGGMKAHASSSLYSDHSLAITGSHLSKVITIDQKLVFFRQHASSFSYTGVSPGLLSEAQMAFLDSAEGVLRPVLTPQEARFASYSLIKWCIGDISGILALRRPDLVLRTLLYAAKRILLVLTRVCLSSRDSRQSDPR
jgi:hypothetical protein